MSKTIQRDLQEIVGGKVEMLLITGSVLSLKLDDHASFDVLLSRLFWRITGKEGILLCSDDFHVKATSTDDYECLPISNDELARFEETHDGDYDMDDLYDYLDEVFEKRMEAMRRLLENATVNYAEEDKWGDFKLSFSTGVTLEAYAGVDYNHSQTPLYRFLKTMP